MVGKRRGGRRERRKSISRQGLLGQQGVNLVERIVLDMGSRWTPSGPNEVGIDGYIELFDPTTQEALGKTIAVQSKAVSTFQNDSPDSFDYWCDRTDLDYWLTGNMPVLLIVSRPASREAYWISVKEYFQRPDANQTTRVHFSKTAHRLTGAALVQLLEVAQSPQAGLYLAPVPKLERLHSNLLAVAEFPGHIYVADTDCRTPRDMWTKLAQIAPGSDGAWILRDRKLMTFHDLAEPPWSLVCDRGTAEGFPPSEWSGSTDLDRVRQFVQLLNRTLRSQLAADVRYWPQEDCYAIKAAPDLSTRRMPYRSAKQRSTISVVSRYARKSGDRMFEWLRHLAFRGRFRRLEGQWYLEITPTYRFTVDGNALDRFHVERLKGIKRIEGNRAVLSVVLFWADYLRRPSDMFTTTVPMLRFRELERFKLAVGLDDNAWLMSDPAAKPVSTPQADTLLLPFPEEDPD